MLWKKWWIVPFRVAALIYVGLGLVLFFGQRALLYFPTVLSAEQENSEASSLGWKIWPRTGGGSFGWVGQAPMDTNQPRWVLLHGNGSLALHRNPVVLALQQTPQSTTHGVYVLEFPGYASQPGKPTEVNLIAQSVAAIDQLKKVSPAPIYLLGESLGTGVACATAAARPNQIQGLLLVTPFQRLAGVAASRFPIYPVSWMLRDRFDSAANLQHYPGSVAVVVAAEDHSVPPTEGEKLYENFTGRKSFWSQPGADHNQMDFSTHSPWWTEAVRFLVSPSH